MKRNTIIGLGHSAAAPESRDLSRHGLGARHALGDHGASLFRLNQLSRPSCAFRASLFCCLELTAGLAIASRIGRIFGRSVERLFIMRLAPRTNNSSLPVADSGAFVNRSKQRQTQPQAVATCLDATAGYPRLDEQHGTGKPANSAIPLHSMIDAPWQVRAELADDQRSCFVPFIPDFSLHTEAENAFCEHYRGCSA